MFERFTDRAGRVMALANEEARRRGHEYIGTEHILFGITEEGSSVAADLLAKHGVDPAGARSGISKLVLDGSGSANAGKLPLTPRAKRLVEYAIEQARVLGQAFVAPEHFLLGIIWERDGVAAQILFDLHVDTEVLLRELSAQMSAPEYTLNLKDSCPYEEIQQQVGETICIGPTIELTVLSIHEDRVRLSIRVPTVGYVQRKTL